MKIPRRIGRARMNGGKACELRQKAGKLTRDRPAGVDEDMRKAAAAITAALLSAATLLLGALSLHRASLPYNEQGRYFDRANSVVLDQGAILVYGLLTGLFAFAALGAILWARRAWRS